MAVEKPTHARAGAALRGQCGVGLPRSLQRGAGTSCGPGLGYSASRRAPSDGGIAGIEGSRIRRPGAVE